MERETRITELKSHLHERILVLDGAMGTAIQQKELRAEDFGDRAAEGCNEVLVLTRPDVISAIHEDHLRAGADIIETNTFGGTSLVLEEFSLGKQAHEINVEAARLARGVADRFSTSKQPRFVAGSIGPTTKAISVTGGISFQGLVDQFYSQAKALHDGGVDFLLLETAQDTRNVKAGLVATRRLFSENGQPIPVAVSGTIEAMGSLLAGQTVEAFVTALSHEDLLYIGLNCATGPEFMTEYVRSMASLSPFPIACVPNAGLPDAEGRYLETPQMMAHSLERFVRSGWVNLIGGCCGTQAAHTEAFAELVRERKPRQIECSARSHLSGLEYLEVADDVRPVIVGERTNVIGSKKFKRLIAEGKFEQASEIAKSQIKKGAQILDICLANPDRDELADMEQFLEVMAQKVKVPLMIDSTDERVVKLALTYSQGKAIINSVNLEDGEERFQKIVPLAREYGAALVVGTIDEDPEQGMAISRTRKLEVAKRSHQLLTEKYGVLPQDIYFDPLVFPCGTGDENYVGSAKETVEGIGLIKAELSHVRTVLGISNVSFGLPPAGREVLNSVFLYHCVEAGLDLAIVNSQKLVRYAGVSDKERLLAENLLFTRSADALSAFVAHFRDKKPKAKDVETRLPLEERLASYVVDGNKSNLTEDLEKSLKKNKPLEIINGPLMRGMEEVGRLFNANKLIVAEVLQSAEVMKAAVAYLEPLMEKNESASRGKVLLATVKGDVHDIGKNLVEIILSNNGFDVINLGIKVPPESLIQAIGHHNPDIVGLSGLLVKSAHQMVTTASDFSEAGIETPLLVGGAALSPKFVDKRISKAYGNGTVAYAKDAMKGLDLAKTIVDPERFEELKQELEKLREEMVDDAKEKVSIEAKPVSEKRSEKVPVLEKVPTPPDLERHALIQKTPIEQIWSFINPMMLYGRHLGVRGKIVRLLNDISREPGLKKEIEKEDPKAYAIWEAVEEVKETYGKTDYLRTAALYQFFRVSSQGNAICLYRGKGNEPVEILDFFRQDKEPGYCLADFIDPRLEQNDTLAIFVVTAGKDIRQLSETLKQKGDYLKSHIVQALALETAEAYAEYIHSQLRRIWGFPDAPEMSMLERFQAKYRGKRYSFGYPACPRLSDQKKLFALIRPEEIGVQLTESYMMDPEASVSALAFHHPQAVYFSAGRAGEDLG